MPVITLVGYRGTGKTTVAAALAARLGCEWVDADVVLEERVGTSIAALVRERGEATFRDEESTILAELLASCTGVLATGGGVVLRPLNRERLRAHGRPIVWLTASCAVIRRRLAADPHTASSPDDSRIRLPRLQPAPRQEVMLASIRAADRANRLQNIPPLSQLLTVALLASLVTILGWLLF
jgi:shikimate kinase